MTVTTNVKIIVSTDQDSPENTSYSRYEEFKGPCATLVLCGRAVLSERVNKPYMNCKQHEGIGKAMATN